MRIPGKLKKIAKEAIKGYKQNPVINKITGGDQKKRAALEAGITGLAIGSIASKKSKKNNPVKPVKKKILKTSTKKYKF